MDEKKLAELKRVMRVAQRLLAVQGGKKNEKMAWLLEDLANIIDNVQGNPLFGENPDIAIWFGNALANSGFDVSYVELVKEA